jgi:beta-phosphoglucomutase-like phosphatase (HAD superfamily)
MEDFNLLKAAIFDMDGTLLDSVDLHALAWQEALLKFGHDVSFEQARSQIGKGGQAHSRLRSVGNSVPISASVGHLSHRFS